MNTPAFPANDPSAEIRLIRRCLTGDTEAWDTLYRHYHATARAFLLKLGVDEAELPDALQDVFLQLFRSLPQFRHDARLRTWLFRLCATQARSVRRRRVLLRELLFNLEESPQAHPVGGLGVSESSFAACIQRALEHVPNTQREVFVRCDLQAQSGKVVAKSLGCTEASVWRRLHHARRSFKSALETELSALLGSKL